MALLDPQILTQTKIIPCQNIEKHNLKCQLNCISWKLRHCHGSMAAITEESRTLKILANLYFVQLLNQ